MQNKEIILTCDPDTGEIQIEAEGFSGKSCKEAMSFLEKTLGKMTDFKTKAEWYQINIGISGKIDSNICG